VAVNVQVLADGSVTVTDGGTTFPPLSPEAVQAIAAQAGASANASNTQAVAVAVSTLADLITAAAPAAGVDAYAQVTVTPGAVAATLDPASFDLVRGRMPGQYDSSGNWVSGPVTVTPKPAPTPPTGGTTP
jgi:hypothetical protein